jgi:hypothetical protein
MSFRRRHRWLRRLALGVALATALTAGRVSVAAAAIDEHGVPARPDPYLSDVFARPGESLGGPDGVAWADATQLRRVGEVAQISDAPPPALARSGAWSFDRGDALILAIGSSILALGLGLALGYLHRPRFAGS